MSGSREVQQCRTRLNVDDSSASTEKTSKLDETEEDPVFERIQPSEANHPNLVGQ